MPLPNFHSCRVREPGDFQKDSIRTITLKGTKGIKLLIGRLKGKTTTTAQSYRFPKRAYTVAQAKSWTIENKIKCILFEPAGKRAGWEIVNAPAIAMYDLKKQIEEEGGSFELSSILSKLFPDQMIACEPCGETEAVEEEEEEDEDDDEGDGEGDEIKFNTDPDTATEEPVEKEYEVIVPIVMMVAKKRTVYGVVYAPEEPDAHNHYMTAETIEVSAHRFMAISRKVDEGHDYIKGAGVPVESFIVREGDKDFVWKEGPQKGKAKVGAWVIATKVISDELWKQILKGEVKAYSLAGMATRGKQKTMYSRWYDDEGNRQDPYKDKADKK